MRRSYLVIIIVLVLVVIMAAAAFMMRSYVMETAVQKLNTKLQKTTFQISDYAAPVTSPFCYENMTVSGAGQAQLKIQSLCISDGLLTLLSDTPTLILNCEKISGFIDWHALKELKNIQSDEPAAIDGNSQKHSLNGVNANLNIKSISLKLGQPGQQLSWHAQNSTFAVKNHVVSFQSVSPLNVDIERAPVAFGNIPTLTMAANADLQKNTVSIQIDADPPIAIDTASNNNHISAQLHGVSADLDETNNLILAAHQLAFTSSAMPAITQAAIQQAQAVITIDNNPNIQTLNIITPTLTLDVPIFLKDPKIRENPVFGALIDFWQQEAGAILGKAPKDSVRREDVKRPKPAIRKNPIPRQTLEKFRLSLGKFQKKLKALPTIDIKHGNITILNHNAHFDIDDIALNTENLFKNSNLNNMLIESENKIQNQDGAGLTVKDTSEPQTNDVKPSEPQTNDVKPSEPQTNDVKPSEPDNENSLNTDIHAESAQEPLQFQLAFNVRNAEAAFSLSFDGDTPFPTAELDIENLEAVDFLRLINMPIPEKSDGEVKLHLKAAISEKSFDIGGNITLTNFAFFHEKISPNLIQDINASASMDAIYDFDADNLRIDALTLASGPVTVNGFIQVTNLRSNPVISFELGAKDVPCRDIPRAIPTGFLPTITDLQFTGTTISPKLSGKIPWKSPLTSSLKESGFENRCIPTSVLPHTPEILNHNDYTFTTNYTYFTDAITVGPGTDTYVPLAQIPPYVKAAMYLTEDKRFFDHGPLRISFIERALRLNLNQRSYVYGGSTISQQLTKNVFLTRSKNLARKLEEAFIAWRMETVVPKSRIFELYLNVIEFGPDVYGIKQAAHFYFDKTPAQLTPLEGAFLASLKVSPSKGARFYKSGFPKDGRWWNKRLKYILKVLAENGYIAPADIIAAYEWTPNFFKPTEPDDYRKIWLDNYTDYLREKSLEKKRLEKEQKRKTTL